MPVVDTRISEILELRTRLSMRRRMEPELGRAADAISYLIDELALARTEAHVLRQELQEIEKVGI